MRILKHLTTWLLLLTVLTASGIVSAKVASGSQNLSGGLHQGNVTANALMYLAKINFSIDAASGFPLATKRTTQSGISVSRHSVNQKINRRVRSADELDALKNPLDVRPVKIDQLGRPSQRNVGRKAEVAVNPETGRIVSVNPTSTKKAERLLCRLEGQ